MVASKMVIAINVAAQFYLTSTRRLPSSI